LRRSIILGIKELKLSIREKEVIDHSMAHFAENSFKISRLKMHAFSSDYRRRSHHIKLTN